MAESSELQAKLKKSDPKVQRYVTALKAENEKLECQIAKLEAEKVTLESRIKAIKNGQPLEPDKISPEETVRRLSFAVNKLGYKLVKKNG